MPIEDPGHDERVVAHADEVRLPNVGSDPSPAENRCPFVVSEVDCSAACEAQATYGSCENAVQKLSPSQCSTLCSYNKAQGHCEGGLLTLLGCSEQTGGACDEMAQCLSESTCIPAESPSERQRDRRRRVQLQREREPPRRREPQ